jgi:apolipoprotein D and lipocalin family protein
MKTSTLLKNSLMVPIIVSAAWRIFAKSKAESQYGPLRKVKHVSLPKYMGQWFIVANIPTFLEKGAHNATETYTWNVEKQRIDVDFKYNKNDFNGEVVSIPQQAYIYDKKSNAEWRTKLFHTLKFPYVIMDLDKDYSYSVVGMPDRSHAWILSRTPSLPEKTINLLYQKIEEAGFDITKLQRVPHQVH